MTAYRDSGQDVCEGSNSPVPAENGTIKRPNVSTHNPVFCNDSARRKHISYNTAVNVISRSLLHSTLTVTS
jgi:hypothetical protein